MNIQWILNLAFAPIIFSLSHLRRYKDFVIRARICKFPSLFFAEPNLKTMVVLNVTTTDFLWFPPIWHVSFFPSFFVPLFRSLRERFHFISGKIREPLSLTISLFILYALQDYISVFLFSPRLLCLRVRSALPFLYSPLCPLSARTFHCWATSQYCNVKHNTLLSKRCAAVKRRMRRV